MSDMGEIGDLGYKPFQSKKYCAIPDPYRRHLVDQSSLLLIAVPLQIPCIGFYTGLK